MTWSHWCDRCDEPVYPKKGECPYCRGPVSEMRRENPRDRGDDDGVEYAHPDDARRGIE